MAQRQLRLPTRCGLGHEQEEILRKGYAYIGLVNQKVGLDGVKKLTAYGDRYAGTDISTDDISYDILSQAGQAVRDQYSVLLGDSSL